MQLVRALSVLRMSEASNLKFQNSECQHCNDSSGRGEENCGATFSTFASSVISSFFGLLLFFFRLIVTWGWVTTGAGSSITTVTAVCAVTAVCVVATAVCVVATISVRLWCMSIGN